MMQISGLETLTGGGSCLGIDAVSLVGGTNLPLRPCSGLPPDHGPCLFFLTIFKVNHGRTFHHADLPDYRRSIVLV